LGLEEAGQRIIVANKAAALLFNCKQKAGEDIAEYIHRFSQVAIETWASSSPNIYQYYPLFLRICFKFRYNLYTL
jgi:hypothetical protein